MPKQILFATTNPNKTKRFQIYYSPLGLSVIDLSSIPGFKAQVEENGKTPEENALKKAMAGFLATGKPAFGVDYWLRIEGLPEDLQPGAFVRRVPIGMKGERIEATDDELTNYYLKLIKGLGGRVKGRWTSAIALVINPNKSFAESFSRETLFVSEVSSSEPTVGEPLNSIQIDPGSGKYFTDLTPSEWLAIQKNNENGYVDFMKRHLAHI